MRGFYSLEDTRTPFLVTVAFSIVMLVLVVTLFGLLTNIGVTAAGGPQIAALAFGYVLAYWFGFAVLWIWLARRLGFLDSGRTVWVIVRLMVVGVATVVLMALTRSTLLTQLPIDGLSAQVQAIIVIIAAGVVGLLAFLLFAWIARVHEVFTVIAMVREKLRARRGNRATTTNNDDATQVNP